MKKIRIAAVLISVLAAAGMFAGCDEQIYQTLTPQQTYQTEQTEQTQQTQLDPNMVVVSTPYGDLYYQEQWEGYMKTEQVIEGSSVKVCFTAQVGDGNYPLFEVTIGEGEGDAVGQLTDSDGKKRNVYVSVEESIEHAELTDEQQRRLYAMQEDINFVIENLK